MMQMGAEEWIDQAADQLARLTPDFQGQVLRQQAALALMQAARDGAEVEQLEAKQALTLESEISLTTDGSYY